MNSRYTAGVGNAPAFGTAGTWTFSYQWTIDPVTVVNTGSVGRPTNYNVNYPDGRRIIFRNTGTIDPDFRGPWGVSDRFEQLNSGATECNVRLPDGGKVWFHANISTTVSGSGSTAKYTSVYTFSLKGIIDPYGLTTTITYPADGSLTVTEPAGRTIKVFSRTITNTSQGAYGDVVVDHITGSDGRSVQYNYTAYITANGTTRYTSLTSVVYFGDGSLTATYGYQPSNVDPNGRPLIKTCTDSMYDGPMWKIAYDFATGANGDGTTAVYGQLLREKHPNGTAVSTLTVNAKASNGYNSRTETRGDNPAGSGNPVRTFTYNTYLQKTATDFTGAVASQTYDSNYYLSSATDRVGNQTTFQSGPVTGIVSQVSYPIPGDVLPIGTQTVLNYSYTNNGPLYDNYYLASAPDGSSYTRDPKEQVTIITHADNSTETFTYNSFGQILTHKLQNGFTEAYSYGSTGLVLAYWDAAHSTSGNPTIWYQYDSLGRVSGMTEGRGTASGDTNYTTSFQYNTPGQLTKLTHPDGSSVQYNYNPNGTLAWTADERHPGAATDGTQRTSYTYDDYKRIRTVTTPLRASGDTTARTSTYFYDQVGSSEDYTRTVAAPTKVVSAGGKIVTTAYDVNLRTVSVTAVGDANVLSATTSYTYDSNGNVLTVKSPNGQSNGGATTYYYDLMNRVAHIDGAMSTDRNSNGHTIDFKYNPSGQTVQEIRVDDNIRYSSYDSMGRLTQQTGYGGEISSYTYDAEGNLKQVTDPYPAWYTYTYDALNRKISATYPADFAGTNRTESYHYDIANRLDKYTNQAGQIKTLAYDNRGRLTNASWSANGPTVTIGYDAARPTSIATSSGTTVAFGYDEANNRIFEDQTVTGLPTRRVQTDLDADGNRTDLLVKTGNTVNFANYFDYTSRNELLNIYDNSHAAFFKYTYDASGNVTQRLGQRLHDTTAFQYDALNRPILCSQSGLNGTNFATSHYDYNKWGLLQDTYRDEEGGKGERFTYGPLYQMASAVYSATQVNTSSPLNPVKSVTYNCGPLNRNGMTVTDNIAQTTTTTNYSLDNLNQYTGTQVNTNPVQSLTYDFNFNLASYLGWNYTYDAENHLTSVSGNGHSAQFVYDAVGRCVKRVLDGTTTIFTYDQWTAIAEWDGNGNLIATNAYGIGSDEILYRSAGSTQLFYKSDPMGNVKFLLDANGNGIEKNSYDAFGQPTITDWSGNVRGTSAYGNRFMFSGRDYISILGLYDLRNRIYDPVMGRFYQTDPIGFTGDTGGNFYRFADNNPVLGGDPSGLDGFFDSILGAFETAFTYVISNSNFGSGSSSGSSAVSDNPLALDGVSTTDAGPFGSGSAYPWSLYASSSLTFGAAFSQDSKWTPQGQFTIGATPSKFKSGAIFEITFVCPTCAQYQSYRLDQDWRGLTGIKNGKYQVTNVFILDKLLQHQQQITNGVTVKDEAGLWDSKGSRPGSGIPVRTGVLNFDPFYQEMVTAAYGKAKDTGNEVLLGVIQWRTDYSPGHAPSYRGIGTHAAIAPFSGSRFHQ
jgi:RHS repeat-associated protein